MEETMSPRRQLLNVRLGIISTVLLFVALPVVAQQQAPAAAPSNVQSETDDKNKVEQRAATHQPTATSNDRLFYALPNFLTVENASQLPPLTAGQKFKIQARSQFDLVEFPWYGFLAGLSQAQNSEGGYGQGGAGYGKRYGAEWGDGGIENFMVGAIFPSVLGQDPRFFQLGKGTFWHRTRYAVGRIFITRSDSGNREFNYSEIFGSALAAGISTYSYHPRGDRNLGNTASVWGTQVALDTMTFVVKEFWPDIRRMISHKRQPKAATPCRIYLGGPR